MPDCNRERSDGELRRLRPSFILTLSFVFAFALLTGLLGGCASGPTADAGGVETAEASTSTDTLTLSAASRRLQIESFETVYTTVRDRHWDVERVGAPWTARYEELRPQLDTVRSQAEARAVMNTLLGSLEQSHFGVFPGPTNEEELVPVGDPRAVLAPTPATSTKVPEPAPEAAPSGAGDEDNEGFPGFASQIVEDRLMVTRVAENTPASRAGVQVGWEVLRVEDRPATAMIAEVGKGSDRPYSELRALRAAAAFVAGPRDTVRPLLFLDRQGRRRDVEIRMIAPEGEVFRMGEQLALPTRTETRDLPGGVAYFALSAFGNPAPVMKEFGTMLQERPDAPGVVIDLRGNPGGLGAMASGLAGFFVDEKGQGLGSMIMRSGALRFVIFPRAETFPGRVAVLIDGASASTSEIFAGGLKDIGRARIFGTTTAGAVLPSEISTLPNGDGFQFATADFETPAGTRLEGRGAHPDVTISHSVEALRRGEDRALEAARLWILSSDS